MTESQVVGESSHAVEEKTSRVGRLLERASHGQRDAAAQLALEYGPAVRRRIRGKLSPRLRRLFDSEDILATVLRRLDGYVASGAMRVVSEQQFIQLLGRISEAAVIDKARLLERLDRVEGKDAPLAHALRARMRDERPTPDEEDGTIGAALSALHDHVDRQILWLWLTGQDHASMGCSVGLSTVAVRKRWMRIRAQLRKALARTAA